MQVAFPLADVGAVEIVAVALVPGRAPMQRWRQRTPPGVPKSIASAVAVPFLRPG
jgi:hypothetical protein